MSATQVEIARRVGIDVSSVNKILNRAPGSVFREETKKRVFRVARQVGYNAGLAQKLATTLRAIAERNLIGEDWKGLVEDLRGLARTALAEAEKAGVRP